MAVIIIPYERMERRSRNVRWIRCSTIKNNAVLKQIQQIYMKLNKSQQYLSTKEIQNKYHVSSATLRRWDCCPRGERALHLNVLWGMWGVASRIGWKSPIQLSKL